MRTRIDHTLSLMVFLALKESQNLCENNIVCIATDNTTVVATVTTPQCLRKQRRGDEIRPSVCPSMENPDLVYQETGYSQRTTHSRPAECGSKQAIQARPDHSNRVISPSRGLPSNKQQVAPSSDRPFCNKAQQQTGSVRVTNTRPPGLGSRCSQSAMGGSGSTCLPTGSHLGQSSGEVAGIPMQKNTIVQVCNEIYVCNFSMLIYLLNLQVFKLQVIFSTVRTNK